MAIKRAATRAALAISIIFTAAPAYAHQQAAPIMVGGYRQADVQDAGVRAAASFAAANLGGAGVTVRTIHSAQQQLVQGMNYKIDFTASNGQRAVVTVYRPLRGAMQVTEVTRTATPAVPRVGGYRNIAATDAGVRAAADFVIDELDDEEFQLDAIESAQVQVVQGLNYRLRLRFGDGSRVQAQVHRPLRGPMQLLELDAVE